MCELDIEVIKFLVAFTLQGFKHLLPFALPFGLGKNRVHLRNEPGAAGQEARTL